MEPTDTDAAWRHDDTHAWDRVKAALRRDGAAMTRLVVDRDEPITLTRGR